MIKLNKSVSHLIIDIIMLTQLNLLINDRLLFHSKLKNCELYHSNYRLIQCFNCQKYNHTVKIYYDTQKCSIYAASKHNDHDCLLKNSFSAHHCVNYNLKHAA